MGTLEVNFDRYRHKTLSTDYADFLKLCVLCTQMTHYCIKHFIMYLH